ncbi:MAG: DUF6178 family protein [Syntrophobacteria bacterium]
MQTQIFTLSGRELLNRILEHNRPKAIVQALPSADFYWLIKKIGDDDAVAVLRMASAAQWQYLVDLEIWRKDRLDPEQTSQWLQRLQQADNVRLVQWLWEEDQWLAHYYFSKSIELVVQDEEEPPDLPDDFFTLDGVWYIRAVHPEHRDMIEKILREMAHQDISRYQRFLLDCACVIPSEIEENMYRLRNVRLAEHGFSPFHEAVSLYAPLDPESLRNEKAPALPGVFAPQDHRALIPFSPLDHAGSENMLVEVTARISDSLSSDRIRLEFAGLCNQLLSADALPVHEPDVLIGICRKAAGYINLALERVCGHDTSAAEQVLKHRPLVSLFRVGFGLVLNLRREALRWLRQSWFHRSGLELDFWGDQWGGTLAGLLTDRPRFYLAVQQGKQYRDFERLADLGECVKVLRRLMVVDSLLERLAERYPSDPPVTSLPEPTFRLLLFTFWARKLLNLEACFCPLSLPRAKEFFSKLRGSTPHPPYEIAGWRETFVADFVSHVSHADAEASAILMETLSFIWQEFQREYERVSITDLDPRYSKFILIG